MMSPKHATATLLDYSLASSVNAKIMTKVQRLQDHQMQGNHMNAGMQILETAAVNGCSSNILPCERLNRAKLVIYM